MKIIISNQTEPFRNVHEKNFLLEFTLKIWWLEYNNNVLKIFILCTSVKLIKLILYFIVILLMNERDLKLKFFEIHCCSTTIIFSG